MDFWIKIALYMFCFWLMDKLFTGKQVKKLKKQMKEDRDTLLEVIDQRDLQIEGYIKICENYEKHFGLEKTNEILTSIEDKLKRGEP